MWSCLQRTPPMRRSMCASSRRWGASRTSARRAPRVVVCCCFVMFACGCVLLSGARMVLVAPSGTLSAARAAAGGLPTRPDALGAGCGCWSWPSARWRGRTRVGLPGRSLLHWDVACFAYWPCMALAANQTTPAPVQQHMAHQLWTSLSCLHLTQCPSMSLPSAPPAQQTRSWSGGA